MHLSHYGQPTLALDLYLRISTKIQPQAYPMLPTVQAQLHLSNVLAVPSQIILL